eukprot:363431-Chlamydomonas_euryale.AAC.6
MWLDTAVTTCALFRAFLHDASHLQPLDRLCYPRTGFTTLSTLSTFFHAVTSYFHFPLHTFPTRCTGFATPTRTRSVMLAVAKRRMGTALRPQGAGVDAAGLPLPSEGLLTYDEAVQLLGWCMDEAEAMRAVVKARLR